MSAIPSDGCIEDGFEAIPVYKQGAHIPHGSPHGPLGANGILAFRHRKSRVKIVMFSAPGPIVSGTIVVGTCPISNAGHPHTLEHIVFLGSQKYPIRGYLDNLACRCIADGTNAWTDNDHTAYTCATAGFEGFTNLMPCFLDHILRPKINDASFVSEVYHVRSDGKEAGVVFCEMQAREHTESDITDRELRGLLLSGTPLSLESGGLCEDIRHLSNEEIIRFHHDQYCGGNVTILVGGSRIVPRELLQCIKAELDDVSSSPGFNPGLPQWRKPLSIQPLAPRTRKVVSFPCPDTEHGTIVFGWRGPGIVHRMTSMAIEVLLHYFAQNVWSPMRQRFVETERQIASDISFSVEVFRDASVIEISLEGVKHLDDDADDSEGEEEQEESSEKHDDDWQGSLLTSGKVDDMVMEFFEDILRSEKLPGGLDYIHAAIKCEKESYLSALESECHSVVASLLIPDIVYGESASLTIGEAVRGALDMFDALHHENEKFWLDLLRTVLVQAPRVEVIMVPDATLADTHSNNEKKALQNRIELYGKEELDAMGKANEDRIASLNPGSFDSSSFPQIPSTGNISRWPYSISQTETSFCVAQSVKLETDLVHCTLFLDMSDLPISERIFLPLLCDLMLSSDIRLPDGSRILYTENARALDRITISTHSHVFIGYANGLADNCLGIHFATTPNCFEEAAKLILWNLFHTEVTAERISVVSQSLLADSTSSMRDGLEALSSMVMLLPYLEAMKREGSAVGDGMFDGSGKHRSIPNFMFDNCIGNHPLLSFLSEEFTRTEGSKGCQKATLQKIQGVVDCLRQRAAEEVFIQVTARDAESAQAALARHWSQLNGTATKLRARETTRMHAHAISRRRYASLSSLIGRGTVGRVAGIGGVETTCIDVRVDSAIHEGHADWSAVTVLVEMLSRMEGPLSDAVRASGLAYGAELTHSCWHGQLSLAIHESSSPTAAWDAVCEVLQRFRDSLDEDAMRSKVAVELDTAKATTLFRIHQQRATPSAIMYGAISRTADGLPASPLADRTLEEKVENVCLGDMARAYDSHIRRLLEDSGRLFVVTCGSNATEETVRAFQECSNSVALVPCAIESLRAPFVEEALDGLRSASFQL